jgi:hypothetical protein
LVHSPKFVIEAANKGIFVPFAFPASNYPICPGASWFISHP